MEGSCYVFSSASLYSCHLHQRIISSASSTVIRVKPLHLLGVSCNIIPILNNNNIYYPLRFLCSSSSSSSFTSSTSSRGTSSSLVPRPTCALIIDDEALDKSIDDHHSLHHSSSSSSSSSSPTDREMLPKIDKSGRFCSPRAARELALSILYAACLQGSDPVRLFEKRLNARREAGYEFDKAYLTEYNQMSFGGPPVNVDSSEEANALQRLDDQESHIEAQVLSAPPKLVYSKLILRFTRKLLVAVVDKWDNHVLVIDKVAPPNWKHEPAGRILEFSILHLAMAEIVVLGTRHQIVINEAVDLAKRFCDGAAPRIINGCLRTFVKNLKGSGDAEETKAKHAVIS